MKKRKFKVLAAVLALALVVTGIPVSSYAWSWPSSSEFNYVAVGDSIAAGSGLNSPKTQAYPVVAGDLISDRLGCRVSTDTIAEDNLLGDGYGFILRGIKMQQNRRLLQKADLISVSAGSTDLVEELVNSVLVGVDKDRVTGKLVKLMTGETELTAANAISAVSGLTLSEKRAVLEAMSPENITYAISNGLAAYRGDFGEVVRYVDEAAGDDAVVAFIGLYNPLCVKAYAYYLAALIDGGSYLRSNQSRIDSLIDNLVSSLGSMSLFNKRKDLGDYLSDIEEFFSSSNSSEQKAGLLSRLMLPVVIAFTDRSSVAAMGTVDSFFEQQVDELNSKGGRHYFYVPLTSVASSGTTSMLPSKTGHRKIAELLADTVLSRVDFKVEGSGSAKIDQKAFSISLNSGSSDKGYVVSGTDAKLTLTPGADRNGGFLRNLLERFISTKDSSILYSVKVNGKTVSPKIDAGTGVGTITVTFDENTTIDVAFSASESNPVWTGYTKKYNKIVSMGDSTVAGLGLEGFDDSLQSIISMSNAKNSMKNCYPRILEEYLDGKLISNLGNSALTTIGLYAALTGTQSNFNYLVGINMDETYYNVFVNYGEICDADLITVQVGLNELLFGIVSEMIAIEGVTDVVATELCQVVIRGGTLQEVIEAFVKTMKSETDFEIYSKAIIEMLKIFENSNLETIFDKSIVTVREYLPKVVAALHDLNPDADIALIGYYNPYRISNIKSVNYRKYADLLSNPTKAVDILTDDAALAEMFSELDYPAAALLLNSVSDEAVKKANSYIEACAKNDPKATYIDVTGISKTPGLSVYPDKQGHIDIADRILEGVVNEVTVKTTGAGSSDVTEIVTTLANNKPDAEKVVTSITGNASAKVTVRFGEPIRIDLGGRANNAKITVDGKTVESASNFYLTGNKKDRTVEVAYGGTSAADTTKVFGLDFYYYPAYGDDGAVNMNGMMNSMDLEAYKDQGYMVPEAPAGLEKLAPYGKKFGGWYIAGCKTARQPGEVIHDITEDTTAYVNWVNDPDSDIGGTSYNVTVKGGVTADGNTSYRAGDRVYVYAEQNEGSFKTWVSSNENLIINDATSTCAYFFMPGEDVEVTATWEGGGTDVGDLPYTDVKTGDWFYDGAKYCYENNIMKGISATQFGPSITTTRAMIVTMLYRLEGSPEAYNVNMFTDVSTADYFFDAVRWAAQFGIVTGVSETSFNPNGIITREQMAAMLYRYAKYKNYDTKFTSYISSFTDGNKVSAYALDAMGWANDKGLITGVKVDVLDPQGSATRAQAGTIFARFARLG